MSNSIPAPETNSPRLATLLDAALAVFVRFGYRKASMDEVARAAGISRQGLYLHYPNKEALFRAAVQHALGSQLAAVVAVLTDRTKPLDGRLVAACDEWGGRYVGFIGANWSELVEASITLTGPMLTEFEVRFEQAVACAIADSPLMTAHRSSAITSDDIARTLHAAIQGLKQMSKTRREFVDSIDTAVQILCAPFQAHT